MLPMPFPFVVPTPAFPASATWALPASQPSRSSLPQQPWALPASVPQCPQQDLMASAFTGFLNSDLPGPSGPCTPLPPTALLAPDSGFHPSNQLPGAPRGSGQCLSVWQHFAHIPAPGLLALGSLSASMIPSALEGQDERKGEPFLVNRGRSTDKLWIWS